MPAMDEMLESYGSTGMPSISSNDCNLEESVNTPTNIILSTIQ